MTLGAGQVFRGRRTDDAFAPSLCNLTVLVRRMGFLHVLNDTEINTLISAFQRARMALLLLPPKAEMTPREVLPEGRPSAAANRASTVLSRNHATVHIVLQDERRIPKRRHRIHPHLPVVCCRN